MNPQTVVSRDAARPGVTHLAIKEKGALYASYMPIVVDGGLFIPTERPYRMGDELYIILTLPGDTQRYTLAAKVIWITPKKCVGQRTQGVGVRFPQTTAAKALKAKIEDILGEHMVSDRPTQTV